MKVLVFLLLTSSVAFPMNFALFHQVIVAGGLDPELQHSSTATRETEKGSAGGAMVTVCGKTERCQLLRISTAQLQSAHLNLA